MAGTGLKVTQIADVCIACRVRINLPLLRYITAQLLTPTIQSRHSEVPGLIQNSYHNNLITLKTLLARGPSPGFLTETLLRSTSIILC